MNSFDWLRDLRAVGGDVARRQARTLITSWLDQNHGWNSASWAPDVLGTRIANWIAQHDFYCQSADDTFRSRVFESLARQTTHLSRVVPGSLQGAALLSAVRGLAFGGLCLPGCEKALSQALRLLDRELPAQVLPDGGHVERNPERHMLVLRHLIDIRTVLRAARHEVPEVLQHAIDRMTPALRFFRHGDGGLSLFNGGREADPAMTDTVLAQSDARGRPLKSAPHCGFERMLAGRTTLVMDTGKAPPPGLDTDAHAGTLSFELTVGRERLIVNCGSHPSRFGPWRGALAATAAHSTLAVAETNSAEVLEQGGLGRRPGRITCERIEGDGATLVEATHDGYVRAFGLVHRRRLYLADNGDDLRGEDTLEGPAGTPFALRFHLHPSVTPTPAAGGRQRAAEAAERRRLAPAGDRRRSGSIREHLSRRRLRRWRRAAPDQSGRRDRRHRVRFHRDQMGATSREEAAAPSINSLKLSYSFTQDSAVMTADLIRVTRALISVSDKTGLIPFGQALAARGVEILSTGGSAQQLRDAGVPVTEVGDHTGFPEMMDGRVKTLHPRVHGGILARRDLESHLAAMKTHDIPPIDLVVVNLYPFEATVARGAPFEDCVENIDIGGPAMIRSAAKNHGFVAVLTDASEYEAVLAELEANDGATSLALRRRLAASAYARTACL